jgi:hypothetical protein
MFFRGFLLYFLLTGVAVVSMAQQTFIDPSDSALIRKYTNFDFHGNFAMMVEKDNLNNYYLVDLTSFSGRFERIWFMNLVFQHPEVVNIDPEISRKQIWFQAHSRYSEKSILDQLYVCKKETMTVSERWSTTEKSNWLKMNDKYK